MSHRLEFRRFARNVRAVAAMCQHTQHDVIRHYVSVVVMVTSRCAFVAVDHWCTGVVTRITWPLTFVRCSGGWQ